MMMLETDPTSPKGRLFKEFIVTNQKDPDKPKGEIFKEFMKLMELKMRSIKMGDKDLENTPVGSHFFALEDLFYKIDDTVSAVTELNEKSRAKLKDGIIPSKVGTSVVEALTAELEAITKKVEQLCVDVDVDIVFED